uniref:Large neutral amino acids transporter small subunit 1 n=1 Tax=Rhabditophanes sp. KR3021 TaxID=114890 RepID=A0AC35U5R6_9BILA
MALGDSEKPETQPLKPVDDNDASEESTTKGGLEKSLTLWNGVTMIVGCIIGSGIFVAPTGVQEKAGSVGLSLLVWLICGIFAGIGSYCYAELGTLIKKSGGDYAYIMEAFGPFLGFVRLWIEAIVVRPCTCTIVALTFSIYMLQMVYPHCPAPDGLAQLMAAALIILLTAINCISVRVATKVQDYFTIAKVIALIWIIATGLYLIIWEGGRYRESFENIWEGTTHDFGSISLAFYSGLFAYQGWNYLNFIVEELQNPRKNLPLAILISGISVTVIYVLTNIAFYAVISPDEMLISPAVAIEYAGKVYRPAAFIMPFFVACSTLGSANGVIFTSSRLFFVGAREGQMPLILTMINKKTKTPIPAVVLTGALSLAYLVLSNNVFSLINYIAISYWLAIAGAIVALFVFRKTMPDAVRPIKVNLIWPTIFLTGCIALVLVPIYGAPKDTAIGIAIMLTAVPVYVVFIAWKNKPKFFNSFSNSLTKFFQILFLVADENEKNE